MDNEAITELRLQIIAATNAALGATANADAANAAAARIEAQSQTDRDTAIAATLRLTTIAATDRADSEAARLVIANDLAAAHATILALRGGAPAGLIPAPLSLTPGQLSPDTIIDFSTKTGKLLYDKAISPFKIIFDGSISNIAIFQDDLNQKVIDYGWNTGAGNIINIADGNGTMRNVITHYGCLSLDQIKISIAAWVGINNRASQNNKMLVKVILDSVSKQVRQKITNQENIISAGTPPTRCAALIFKLIMNKTIIDTRATSAAFRRELMNLDVYMVSSNSNIEKFNDHVVQASGGLLARGERVDDLITNLFKGYKVADDIEFVSSIKLWESAYYQGDDLTADTLMSKALNDYNAKVISQSWGAQSEEQTNIIALKAELQDIKDQNIKLSTSVLKQLKGQKYSGPGNRGRASEAWKSTRGTGPNTKVVKNVTYHWCDFHKCWNLHTTADCKARKKSNNVNTSSESSESTQVQVAATYAATMESIREALDSDDQPVE